MTQVEIVNLALGYLGVAPITTMDDAVASARIMTTLYAPTLKYLLVKHPWNFAMVRVALTELGGEVETWTAEGTTNVWKAALTTEPSLVKFNGTEGTEQTSIAACTAENYWFWESDVLYVYAASNPDTLYVSPGIEAIIPAFDYDHAYALPSDILRVIRMDYTKANFKIEGTRLFTNENTAKILYIKYEDDPTALPPTFCIVLALRLAVDGALQLNNDKDLKLINEEKFKIEFKSAKAVDGQEGTIEPVEDDTWLEDRSL